MREIVNGIFYVMRSGCPWRQLPKDLPPWSTVYRWFAAWRDACLFEKINHALVITDRERVGREASPSAAIIDSQSIKTTEAGGPARGLSLSCWERSNKMVSGPLPSFEGALGDERGATAHCIQGLSESTHVNADTIDANNMKAACLKMIQIALLMQSASLRQNLQKWVPDERLTQLTFSNCEIEICQIATVEMSNQIGSTEVYDPVCSEHIICLLVSSASGS